MMAARIVLFLPLVFLSCGASSYQLSAQNHFPDPIARGLRVGIEDFATVPDSNGAPARMSVMTSNSLGRMFVGDQRGLIHNVGADGSVTPYIDIRSFTGVNLVSSGERGFQSFAFHPDFANNGTGGFGKFYTIHSSNNTTPTADFALGTQNVFHSVVMEWTTNNPTASTYAAGGNAAPREILRFSHPFNNHNGGQLGFNTSVGVGHADRNNLYIGMGDGGSGGDPFDAGQDLSNPFGALLRIDPLGTNSANGQYGIVADNVFAADGSAATVAEIYAYGLRNPQRFGWDDNTGNLYLADIGQNAVEEIDSIINGGNYGWDEREGSFQFEGAKTPDMIDPVAEYDHTNPVANMPTSIGNRAITVGDVARGSGIPGLDGKLLLGDFPTGLIFTLDVDNDPLDGGQDGLRQLILVDSNGDEMHLLQLINAARADRGLGAVSRTDLRFSYGLDGDIFILNKHDGIIRRLTVVPEPSSTIAILLGIAVVLLPRTRRRRFD